MAHLTANAHTSLKGWYSPVLNTMIRAESIASIKVASTTVHFTLLIEYSQGQKQEFRFATLELLNEALDPLHLAMTDL